MPTKLCLHHLSHDFSAPLASIWFHAHRTPAPPPPCQVLVLLRASRGGGADFHVLVPIRPAAGVLSDHADAPCIPVRAVRDVSNRRRERFALVWRKRAIHVHDGGELLHLRSYCATTQLYHRELLVYSRLDGWVQSAKQHANKCDSPGVWRIACVGKKREVAYCLHYSYTRIRNLPKILLSRPLVRWVSNFNVCVPQSQKKHRAD